MSELAAPGGARGRRRVTKITVNGEAKRADYLERDLKGKSYHTIH